MVRLCNTLAGFLMVVAPLGAQDFFDDFDRDDGPAEGWFTYQGVANIVEDELLVEGLGVETWTWIDAEEPWDTDEISIQFEVSFDPSDSAPEVGRHGGIMFFASDKTVRWELDGYVFDWIDRAADHGYRFHRWVAGAETAIIPDGAFSDHPDPGGLWRITVQGPMISFYVDGELLAEFEDETYRTGHIGLYAYSNGNHIHIDNLIVSEDLPRVEVAAEPTRGEAPLEVSFDGSGSASPFGEIVEYRWDFGDGETGEGAVVTHTYTEVARRSARLTIVDEVGVSASGSVDILVECPVGDLSPWTTADVGEPVEPGCAAQSGECFDVVSGGDGISGRADGFRFVYQEVTGDTVLTAHLTEAEVQSGARMGVMLRGSLEPDSIFAFSGYQQTGAALPSSTYRDTVGSNSRSRSSRPTVEYPNSWMRVERQGDDFILSKSADGEAWEEIRTATIPDAPDTMLAGLAVTSSDRLRSGLMAQVTICDITVGDGGGVDEGPRFVRGDVDSSGSINLTDGVAVLNYLFLGAAAPSCLDAGDFDDSGGVDLAINDAIGVFNWLFIGGEGPAPPAPAKAAITESDCGVDPTPDDGIGCEDSSPVCG